MKEQILKLKEEGKTYNEIQSILGCSKGTISYHLGKGQKEKTLNRTRKRRLNIIIRRLETFKNRVKKNKTESVRKFQKRVGGKLKIDANLDKTFTIKDVLDKFGENTFCYLSGEPINLLTDEFYSFDHIFPFSKGGDNSLENLGIVHEKVNYIKSDLTKEELFKWLIKILEFNNYKVIKNTGVV